LIDISLIHSFEVFVIWNLWYMVLRTAIQVYLWFFEREKSNKM